MKNISFGQYYPAESIIHKLDPRSKVIFTVLYIVCSFLCKNILSFAALILFSAFIVILSQIPFKTLFRSIKPLIIIMVFMSFLNLFMTQGGLVIFELGIIKITSKGIYAAASAVVRVVSLVIGTSIFLTYTTTPISLTDGLESLLSPLKKFKVPVHEIAMMMSIALRFIPILMEETDKIMKAQIARGADFESGNIIKKAKALVPLLVPLFISAFRRANDLAMAMEARCYRGGDGRTKMKPLIYKKADSVGYSVLALYLLVCLSIGKITQVLFGILLGLMMAIG